MIPAWKRAGLNSENKGGSTKDDLDEANISFKGRRLDPSDLVKASSKSKNSSNSLLKPAQTKTGKDFRPKDSRISQDKHGKEKNVEKSGITKPQRPKKKQSHQSNDSIESETSAKAKLDYLSAYYNDRTNWKFSKSKQNWIIKNAFNLSAIGPELEEPLTAYIASLHSGGCRTRILNQLAEREEKSEEHNKDGGTIDDEDYRMQKRLASIRRAVTSTT